VPERTNEYGGVPARFSPKETEMQNPGTIEIVLASQSVQ
jgi:hypothetical protein